MMRSARTLAFTALLLPRIAAAAEPPVASPPAVTPAAPAPGAASPDAPPESAKEVARARFLAGVKAYDERRYKDAVDLLLEADRAMHSPAFAYNIGVAYEAMGDVPSALRWLRSYVREVPDGDDLKEVARRISALEARLQARGVQQATVLSAPEGATTLVDSKPVGVTPWTGELSPGRHRLTLQLAGHRDHEQIIEVLPHRADDFSVSLRPVAAPQAAASPVAAAPGAPPPSASDEPSTLSKIKPWTWATLGGGVLALGGAVVLEMSRASAADEARSASQLEFQDKLDAAESRQTTARILAGVGGALVVAGGVLLVLDLSSESEGRHGRVAAGCTLSGCYATGGGAF
jgi:hypothetical protein